MFDSLLNFRPIGGKLFYKHDGKTDTNSLKFPVYRCARPDHITKEDLDLLQSKLGIKYVMDLRNYTNEYCMETGMKLLDNNLHSETTALKIVDMEKIESRGLKNVVYVDGSAETNSDDVIYHFIVGFFGRSFALNLLQDRKMPLWKRIYGFFLLILHILFNTSHLQQFISNVIFEGGLLRLYTSLIDYSGNSVRCILQIISQQGEKPFIVCCHAGKDRTGVISAILLSICGFDKATICDDYAMSEVGLPISHSEMESYKENMRHAPWGVMHQFLEYVDETYGSMENYLISIGFSAEEQKKLKEQLNNSN